MGRIKPCKQFSRMPSWSKCYGSISYYRVLETLSLPASSWHWGKWDPERRKKLPTRGQFRIKNWIFRPPTLISFLGPVYVLTRSCKPVAHRLNILFAFFIVSFWDFPVTQTVKNLPAVQETRVRSLGREDPLAKGIAIHSSILDWTIPWTEEPGRLQSMGSQRWTRLTQWTWVWANSGKWWRAGKSGSGAVHRVLKSGTQLSDSHTHTHEPMAWILLLSPLL